MPRPRQSRSPARRRVLAPVLDGPALPHERSLLTRLTEDPRALPGVRVLRIWPDSPDRIAVASFVLAHRPVGYVAAYLSAEDVYRLLAALRQLVTEGARWTYAPGNGHWTPTPDPRDLDPLAVGTATTSTGNPACAH